MASKDITDEIVDSPEWNALKAHVEEINET
jgi:hypothetical protein